MKHETFNLPTLLHIQTHKKGTPFFFTINSLLSKCLATVRISNIYVSGHNKGFEMLYCYLQDTDPHLILDLAPFEMQSGTRVYPQLYAAIITKPFDNLKFCLQLISAPCIEFKAIYIKLVRYAHILGFLCIMHPHIESLIILLIGISAMHHQSGLTFYFETFTGEP